MLIFLLFVINYIYGKDGIPDAPLEFYNKFERTSVVITSNRILFKFHFADIKKEPIQIRIHGTTTKKLHQTRSFLIHSVHFIIPKKTKDVWIKCYTGAIGENNITISHFNRTTKFDSYNKFCRFVAADHSSIPKIENLINHHYLEYKITGHFTKHSSKELEIRTCHDHLASRIHPKIQSIHKTSGDRRIIVMENGPSFDGVLKDSIYFVKGILDKDYIQDNILFGLANLVSHRHNHYKQIYNLKSPFSISTMINRQQMGSYNLGLHHSFRIIKTGESLFAKVHGHFTLNYKQQLYRKAIIDRTKISIKFEGNLIRIKIFDKEILLMIGKYNKIKYKCWFSKLIDKDFEYLDKEIIENDQVVNYMKPVHCKDLESGVLDELELTRWKYIKREIHGDKEVWVIYYKTKNYSKKKVDKKIIVTDNYV